MDVGAGAATGTTMEAMVVEDDAVGVEVDFRGCLITCCGDATTSTGTGEIGRDGAWTMRISDSTSMGESTAVVSSPPSVSWMLSTISKSGGMTKAESSGWDGVGLMSSCTAGDGG